MGPSGLRTTASTSGSLNGRQGITTDRSSTSGSYKYYHATPRGAKRNAEGGVGRARVEEGTEGKIAAENAPAAAAAAEADGEPGEGAKKLKGKLLFLPTWDQGDESRRRPGAIDGRKHCDKKGKRSGPNPGAITRAGPPESPQQPSAESTQGGCAGGEDPIEEERPRQKRGEEEDGATGGDTTDSETSIEGSTGSSDPRDTEESYWLRRSNWL